MIDFPQNPTVGQTFVAAGVSWTWDGVKWVPTSGTGGAFVLKTGDTMTGNLGAPALSGATPGTVPVAAANPMTGDSSLDLATTAWVNQAVNGARWGDNRIINGDMRIDQRNNGASGTAAGYTIDRWLYSATQVSRGSWGRGTLGAPGIAATGCGYNLGFASSSAYASLATDNFQFAQKIEADFVSDFAWGTSSAQPVTLSFWATSSLTGTFGGSICNDTGARSYPFSFSLPTTAWTKIAITIPGDIGGTWVLQGSGNAMWVRFDLGSGANFRGPAGAWASANYVGVTGTQSIVAVNGATFNFTGVKLEIGSVATPFNRQSLAKSMADCQRYYQILAGLGFGGYGSAATQAASDGFAFNTAIRTTPTMTFGSTSFSNCGSLTMANIGPQAARAQISVTAAGQFSLIFNAILDAEL